MVLTSDGVQLYVEKTGDGPNPVVIPQRIYLREYFGRLMSGRAAVFYDPRNRGLSETVTVLDRLSRGIVHDAEDLEAIRLHFRFDQMAIHAHSYIGIAVLMYAAVHPERVSRLILFGPPPPDPLKVYPADLRSSDGSLERFNEEFANLRSRAAALSPRERCRETWALLRRLYFANPADAGDLRWEPCDIPNEANFMPSFMKYIVPSLAAARMSKETLSRIRMPTLVLHGRQDRSAHMVEHWTGRNNFQMPGC